MIVYIIMPNLCHKAKTSFIDLLSVISCDSLLWLGDNFKTVNDIFQTVWPTAKFDKLYQLCLCLRTPYIRTVMYVLVSFYCVDGCGLGYLIVWESLKCSGKSEDS